nr:FAD-dependent oxidoreductase [uncultured Sphingomonas sp.]
MAIRENRFEQMFPVLTPQQIAEARRFASGPPQRFDPGAAVYAIGDEAVPSWLVLDGTMDISRRQGLGGVAVFTRYQPGQFSGEISQLAGRPVITAAVAGAEGCTAMPFDAAHLRALMVGSAELGELVMRALILRRVELIEDGDAGTVLIGAPDAAETVRLQSFLTRAGFPVLVLDATADEQSRALIERTGVGPDDLPLVVCPDGRLLRRASELEVATCLGMAPRFDYAQVYDVAVVGAGPAGLATAVYAASEGLSVLVLDAANWGGQAGASARIENYLGFPTGISGQALAGRGFTQAVKFGATVAVPLAVDHIDCFEAVFALVLADRRRVRARAVVIASGAAYRRPNVPGLAMFEGRGISYWASPIEARLCAGERVALVGGGNSAGQAVAYLAPQVERLDLYVRRPLEATMSRYLVDRIHALDNVGVHVGMELVDLRGDARAGLQGVTFRDLASGRTEDRDLRHLFLLIGADPNTAWLRDCVATDASGFIRTGDGPRSLETSRPGMFAIGDVRSGSTKRVAAAVGEGASVVQQLHAFFGEEARHRLPHIV